MANIVNKKLSIDKNNIKQYCDAQNVSFNVSDHAWRKWLNGSTDGYVILKSEGKAVLYPTETARPFKADSLISASRSAGTCTVDLQFGGVQVHNESYTSGTQKHKSKANITDSAVTNSTKATEIKWHVYGKNSDNQRGDLIELTLYFNQYSAQALIGNGANGVQSVSVSSFAPYYGDTITFGVKLVQGATFDGWYSDSACTQLVSTDTTYSIAPTADVTLYAKATTDATLYNVSAVAGSEIPSVNVSDSIVPEGGTATFTAQVNTGCSFEAWYSDDTYATVVSTENPYTATITANTTLYAKAHRSSLNMFVGSAEHGTANVNATTVPYGSDVTFTFAPEDETWELYGWYSDSGLTQLVSEANPYTFTATEDVTLYPKIGKKRYKITFGEQRNIVNGDVINIDAIAVYYDQLTREEKACLRTGNFNEIDNNKIINRASVRGNAGINDVLEDIYCPYDAYVSFYAHNITSLGTIYCFMFRRAKGDYLSYWPYYWYQPTGNANVYVIGMPVEKFCNCSAVAKDGIVDAYATTPTFQEKEAIFEAELSPGYTFLGWYSDEACTKLVSAANPANVVTPKYTTDDESQTSLTLYAKATKAIYTISVGTAEHCTPSVSATTAYYGDTVTFNCVVDEGYEFKGWYSDEGLTQLVSESASYEHTVTGDVTLWAKVAPIKGNLLLHPTGYDEINILEGTEIKGIERIYINDESAAKEDSAKITIPPSKYNNPISLGFYIDGSKFTNIPNNAIITDITISSTLDCNTILDELHISKFCTAKRTQTNGTVSYTRIGENKYKNAKVLSKKTYSLTKDNIGSWSPEELKNGQFGIILSTYSASTSSTYDKIIIYNINILINYTMPENEQVFYTVNAVTMDHCTTTVSATIAQYGDNVIFKCMVDKGYEFKGWYSNEELTQFVSKDAEYTHNIIGNVILWPKIEIANNNFIIHPTGYNAINFKSSTKIENAECLYENDSNSSTDSCADWLINGEQDGNTSTNPASLAFYVAGEKFINIPDNAQITDINVLIRMGDTLITDYGALATLHEIYTAQRNIENEEVSYNQMGIKKYTDKSSIPETKINSYTLTNAEVGSWTPTTLKAGQFSIILSASYNKKGLFKNTTPNIYNIDIFVSYALPGTGFSFKSNGTWKNTVAVFKKVDGAWVQQSNPKTLFSGSSTGSESNYIYCGDVSS